MNKLISIVGTNASGKSDLGLKLARHYHSEVVSADSRQVYKYLDLGTGKISKEEMSMVKHHLIDILELNEPFSLAQFQELAYRAIDDICDRGLIPFLVGGTGLYTRAIVEGYNLVDAPPDERLRKELAAKSSLELLEYLRELGDDYVPTELNCRRLIRRIEKIKQGVATEQLNCPRYDVLQLGLTWEKEELYRRIAERLDRRIKQGMIEEVENIISLGATPTFLENLGLEYRLTYYYLTGKYQSMSEYRDELYKQICHFAKRQLTWFKKEKNIIWLNQNGDYFSEARSLIDKFLSA